MKAKSKRLLDVFSALGDSTRLELLILLRKNDNICVSELASKIGISNAGVSQQLKILEQAGLIKRQRIGQKICYEVKENDQLNKQLISLVG